MARIADRVRDLIEEDPAMEEAVEVVLERAGGGELQWSDVSDELTSGQWGRLIETGVLEGGDEGMAVADPDAIRVELYGEPEPAREGGAAAAGAAGGSGVSDEGPPGDSSWSTWDKLAGLVALSLFPGYYLNSIRNTVGSAVDAVLGPLDAVLPFYGVILILAVLTGLYSTLLMDNLMNVERMAYYQDQMQEIQDRREAAKERGDDEALEEIQEEQMEAMAENLGMFKEQIKPMAWTMVLIIPVFLWMYWKIDRLSAAQGVVLPLIGERSWSEGVGPMPSWIVWYFVCSMGFSQVLRKALNVRTSPGGGSSSSDDEGAAAGS
ncbi:MAG: DUF106 domain-containing protein [Halobacteriaceae archaeon]